MKNFLVSLLIAGLTVLSCSSEKAGEGISGRYVGTQTFGIGQVSSPMMLTLHQQNSVLAGSVTPPFRTDFVEISNGRIEGNSMRFDANYQGFTFHYEGVVQDAQLQGNFQPLGCVLPSSGELCVTDSDGTFTLQKQ